MAEQFAKNLLAEIETEGFDEFLLTQYAIAREQASGYLAIPTLDTLLQPDLPGRSDHAPRRACPPLIEVAGAGPCSGKTQLLYRIAAGLLLGASRETSPAAEDNIELETTQAEDTAKQHHYGENSNRKSARAGGVVIWIDCAGTFDIRRLDRVLASLSSSDPLSLRLSTLAHFHLHRPASFSSLLDTLSSLPASLLGRSARIGSSASAHRPVAALILSSASSFLPFERAAAHSASTQQAKPYGELDARYSRLVALLRNVQHRLGCPVIATRRAGAVGPGLPASWVKAVDVRLRVSRDDWREKIPQGISWVEALEWREARKKARQQAEDEERERERAQKEIRAYIEGQEEEQGAAERPIGEDVERTEQALPVRMKEIQARFTGSVAGKGREVGVFAMHVDSGGVWIEGSSAHA